MRVWLSNINPVDVAVPNFVAALVIWVATTLVVLISGYYVGWISVFVLVQAQHPL